MTSPESLAAVRRIHTVPSGRCNRVVVENADRGMNMQPKAETWGGARTEKGVNRVVPWLSDVI